jgi:hypothetical protein
MKRETIHEHAKRIELLYNHQREIARDEGLAFEDYTARDLVLTAASLLDVMEEWDAITPYDRGQQRRLRKFVEKWKEVTP